MKAIGNWIKSSVVGIILPNSPKKVTEGNAVKSEVANAYTANQINGREVGESFKSLFKLSERKNEKLCEVKLKVPLGEVRRKFLLDNELLIERGKKLYCPMELGKFFEKFENDPIYRDKIIDGLLRVKGKLNANKFKSDEDFLLLMKPEQEKKLELEKEKSEIDKKRSELEKKRSKLEDEISKLGKEETSELEKKKFELKQLKNDISHNAHNCSGIMKKIKEVDAAIKDISNTMACMKSDEGRLEFFLEKCAKCFSSISKTHSEADETRMVNILNDSSKSEVERFHEFAEKFIVPYLAPCLHDKNIPMNEKFLNDLGVMTPLSHTSEFGSMVYSLLENMKSNGLQIPAKIFVEKFPGIAYAYSYVLPIGRKIMPKHPIPSVMCMPSQFEDEFELSSFKTFVHEFGHFSHYSKMGKIAKRKSISVIDVEKEITENFDDRMRRYESFGTVSTQFNENISKNISYYATTNVLEFVAEIVATVYEKGKAAVEPDVINLYEEVHGNMKLLDVLDNMPKKPKDDSGKNVNGANE
jgi:hypothetical protein